MLLLTNHCKCGRIWLGSVGQGGYLHEADRTEYGTWALRPQAAASACGWGVFLCKKWLKNFERVWFYTEGSAWVCEAGLHGFVE